MSFAFIDESGTEAPFATTHFLVVALLSAESERAITLPIRRAHKRYAHQIDANELKANASPPELIRYVLGELAAGEISILAAIVDKHAILRPPVHSRLIYQAALGHVIGEALRRWPGITIFLDKRYTTQRGRAALEQAIRQDLGAPSLTIRQEDSRTQPGLQAVDYVAWALFQKYERRQPDYYQIIAERMVVEDVITRELW